MLDFLQSWCATIVFFLLILILLLWLQLLKWKNYDTKHKKWQNDNCSCDAPAGNPEPGEPTWP